MVPSEKKGCQKIGAGAFAIDPSDRKNRDVLWDLRFILSWCYDHHRRRKFGGINDYDPPIESGCW